MSDKEKTEQEESVKADVQMLGGWVIPLRDEGYYSDANDSTPHLCVYTNSERTKQLGWIRCESGKHHFKPVNDPSLLEEQKRLVEFMIEYSPGTASDELKQFGGGIIGNG